MDLYDEKHIQLMLTALCWGHCMLARRIFLKISAFRRGDDGLQKTNRKLKKRQGGELLTFSFCESLPHGEELSGLNFRSAKAVLQSCRNMWKFRIDRRWWLPTCQTWAKKVQYLADKIGASGLQQLVFWTVWFMIVPVDYSWSVLLYK